MDDDGWLVLILGALGLLALASFIAGKPPAASAPTKTTVLQPIISNEETWNWIDWQGRNRSVTIHRTVKTDGSA